MLKKFKVLPVDSYSLSIKRKSRYMKWINDNLFYNGYPVSWAWLYNEMYKS